MASSRVLRGLPLSSLLRRRGQLWSPSTDCVRIYITTTRPLPTVDPRSNIHIVSQISICKSQLRSDARTEADASLFLKSSSISVYWCNALTEGMSSTVHVFVISPDTRSERRFELHTPVGQLKVRHSVGRIKVTS